MINRDNGLLCLARAFAYSSRLCFWCGESSSVNQLHQKDRADRAVDNSYWDVNTRTFPCWCHNWHAWRQMSFINKYDTATWLVGVVLMRKNKTQMCLPTHMVLYTLWMWCFIFTEKCIFCQHVMFMLVFSAGTHLVFVCVRVSMLRRPNVLISY